MSCDNAFPFEGRMVRPVEGKPGAYEQLTVFGWERLLSAQEARVRAIEETPGCFTYRFAWGVRKVQRNPANPKEFAYLDSFEWHSCSPQEDAEIAAFLARGSAK